MTIAVDVATRTAAPRCCARRHQSRSTRHCCWPNAGPGTDAAGWANALRLSGPRMPHARLLDVDARMREAAARPVIVP